MKIINITNQIKALEIHIKNQFEPRLLTKNDTSIDLIFL